MIVWAHNSHLGDARATQMGERGELNLGQLVREQFGKEASRSVSLLTMAPSPRPQTGMRPPNARTCARLIPTVTKRFFTRSMSRISCSTSRGNRDLASHLRDERLERAIGVIYRPDTELISHYFHARLPDQFDAILHYDHTRAVEPLERTAEWEMGEVEETFPSGL